MRQERVDCNATSALLTGWKKTDELAFLNEVSSVPLQQALRHLQVAYTNFFAKRAKYPTFKSKKRSRRSAEYTTQPATGAGGGDRRRGGARGGGRGAGSTVRTLPGSWS